MYTVRHICNEMIMEFWLELVNRACVAQSIDGMVKKLTKHVQRMRIVRSSKNVSIYLQLCTYQYTLIPAKMSRILFRNTLSRSLRANTLAPSTIPLPFIRHLTPTPTASPRLFTTTPLTRYAESTTPHSTFSDPSILESQKALEEGSSHLESGNFSAAKDAYLRSISIKESSSAHFNLGVVHFQLKDLDSSIASFEKSLQLMPDSPDTHTNLASAHIMATPPRPDRAMNHLKKAAELDPKDGEIWFNLAAVLEACEQLEESLKAYNQARELGIQVRVMQTKRDVWKVVNLTLGFSFSCFSQRADQNYRSEWIVNAIQ